MTRGAYRLLARAILMAPATVDSTSRSDARAAELLRGVGLFDAVGKPTSAAAPWAAIPREHLAVIAAADSIAVARAVLAVYGILDDFAGRSAKIAGNSPENGGNPPQNGRNSSRSASESYSVVVPFSRKQNKENNNSNSSPNDPEGALLRIGMAPQMAHMLGRQYTYARILEVISAARSKPRDNLPGWVRMALQDKWGMSPERQATPAATLHVTRNVDRAAATPGQIAEWPQWRDVIRRMPDIVQSLRAIREASAIKIIAPNQYVAAVVSREYLAELTKLITDECGEIQLQVMTEAQCA